MAEEGAEFVVKGTVGKVVSGLEQFIATIEAQAAELAAAGDTARSQIYENQAAKLRETQIGARAPTQADSNAIVRENTLRKEGAAIEKDTLSLIQEQTAALLEQQGVRERLQGASLNPLATSAAAQRVATLTPGTSEAAAVAAQRQVEEAAALLAAKQGPPVGLSSERQLSAAGRVSAVTPEAQQAAQERVTESARQAALAAEQRRIAEERTAAVLAQQDALYKEQNLLDAHSAGFGAGAAGRALPAGLESQFTGPSPAAVSSWSTADAAAARYNITLGEYEGLATRSSLSTTALSANLTRLGVADAEASSQLRKHGALTTEFLGALARGETTVSEFGYQIGATIGKFAGWTAAASATYGALGAVYEFGKGAIDTASATQRLTRTINDVNPAAASSAISKLSTDTNVSMKEAGDAVFQFSRTFHNLDDASAAAGLGLAALKLDNVGLADSVRASTAITTQFKTGIGGLKDVYNELSAAQREYNARISEMIPLLQKSSGAVANAGGDLTSLIQIGAFAQRVTQLGGAQIGTALYRSAATFTNPSTTKGQADRAEIQNLGVNVNQGITGIIQDAIRRSTDLSQNQRSQLANSIFGPQYGGRLSAIFNPNDRGVFEQITSGKNRLTPETTKGSLQDELTRELGTAGEQLKSFLYELQRLGAEFANTGAINIFAGAVHELAAGIGIIGNAVDVFNNLPTALKEGITGLLAFRAAMLLTSRTRFGSSAPLITRIPGFAPSEATTQRAQLAIGTRSAIQSVEQELEQTSTGVKALGVRVVLLQQQKIGIDAELAGQVEKDEALLQESNSISLRIVALQREQAELEARRLDADKALSGLKAQSVGLTASSFSTRRYPDSRVNALYAQVNAGTIAEQEAAVTAQAGAAELDSQQQGLLARAKARTAALLRINTTATTEATAGLSASAKAAAGGTVAATEEGAVASAGAAEATAGVASRIGTFVSAIDPLTAALVALPFAFQALSGSADNVDKQLQQDTQQARRPITSLQSLDASVAAYKAAQARRLADQRKVDQQRRSIQSGAPSLSDILNAPSNAAASVLDSIGPNPQAAAAPQVPGALNAQVRETYAKSYDALYKQAVEDAKAAGSSESSRNRWYSALNQLKAKALAFAAGQGAVGVGQFGSETVVINKSGQRAQLGIAALAGFNTSLQTLYKGIESKLTLIRAGQDPLAGFKGISSADIAKQVAYADDYSKSFGSSGNNSIRQAVFAYTALTQKLGAGGFNDADLAKLNTAQGNLTSTISTTVSKLVTAAGNAPTADASRADLAKATQLIERIRQQEQKALDAAIAEDKGNVAAIRRAKASADVIFQALNSALATVSASSDTLIQQQTALAVSQVSGSSPESDVSRQQITLNGLKSELANAQRTNAPGSKVSDLQRQINDASNALAKTQESNARSVLSAQGSAATASITGIDPASDIARARQDIANAQAQLGFDQSHGAGQAAILTDQAALYNAERSLNQSIQQHDQQLHQDALAYLQAQSALKQSQTLDPIKQAREQLATDIQALALIKRSDYQTQQQYETALLTQRTTVNKDRTGLNDQIVNQDEATLKFELATNKIGDQQYINGLQQILRTKKLTLAQRQQLQQEIYQTQQGLGANNDLNVGNIKLPSVYQIRRAIGLGQRGELPGAQNTVINHTAAVTVNVYGEKGAHAVGRVLDQHLNTTVRSAMRAKGV